MTVPSCGNLRMGFLLSFLSVPWMILRLWIPSFCLFVPIWRVILMSIKSRISCEFSAENVRHPHLWTFTLPVKLPPRVAAAMWRDLSRDLVRYLHFAGIRVFEPHPAGHGLHVHVVAQGRYSVDDVRDLCLRHGWGRIHVQRIKGVGGAAYVAKYINKTRRVGLWKGIRLWGAVGKRFLLSYVSKSRDIVNDSELSRRCREYFRRFSCPTASERLALLRAVRDEFLGFGYIREGFVFSSGRCWDFVVTVGG